ncbi:MAG: hypothetical protein H0T13_09015 [Actinobacteria bacterium]|nr:hypothetical protein [Actinomycetota bacterium]
MRRYLLLAGLVVALLAPGQARADNPKLEATVGPGFSIRIAGPDGKALGRIAAGTYDITVRDLAEDHNFHLQGPGVEERTGLEFVGTVTWTVTLRDGRYTFVCDPHSTTMRGSFLVGDAPAPAPPPPVQKLVATVGPGATITLRTASGAVPRGLKAGTYSIVVRDRSRLHNVHLAGAGIDRKSARAGTGTVTWRVRLRSGTLRFFSDAAPARLRGSVRIS